MLFFSFFILKNFLKHFDILNVSNGRIYVAQRFKFQLDPCYKTRREKNAIYFFFFFFSFDSKFIADHLFLVLADSGESE